LTFFTIVVTAQIEQMVIMTDGVHRYVADWCRTALASWQLLLCRTLTPHFEDVRA
jgi:hypothetical protein